MRFPEINYYISLFTGLSVKDYLEGKEGKHKELMYKSSKAGKKSGASGGAGLVPGARSFFADGEETSYVSEDIQVGFGGRPRWGLGWGMGIVRGHGNTQ